MSRKEGFFMDKRLVLHDFRASEQLERAKMFYEGGASSCCGYSLKLNVELDTPLEKEKAAPLDKTA